MASGQKVKPGNAGIWIGIVMIVAGIAAFVVPIVMLIGAFTETVEDARSADRVAAGSTLDFEVVSDGNFVVIGWGARGASPDSVSAKIVDSNGRTVAVESADVSGNSSFEINGESAAILAIALDVEPGSYTLETSGEPSYEVAVAPTALSEGTLASVVWGFLGGILLGLIGFILALVTFFRRRKAKKAAAMAAYIPTSGGYAPPQGFGAPPVPGAPQGFGAPPAPGAPPGPGGYTPPPAPPAPPAPSAPGGPAVPPIPQSPPAPQQPAPWGAPPEGGSTPPAPGQYDAPTIPTPPPAAPPAPPAPPAWGPNDGDQQPPSPWSNQ